MKSYSGNLELNVNNFIYVCLFYLYEELRVGIQLKITI